MSDKIGFIDGEFVGVRWYKFFPISYAAETGGMAGNYRKVDLGAAGNGTVHFLIKIPSVWDPTKKIKIRIYGYSNGVATGNYRFELGVEYVKHGEIVQNIDVETIAWTEVAGEVDNELLESAEKEFDNALAEAGDLMNIRVTRLGPHAEDTRPNDFSLLGIEVIIEF